MAGIALTTSLAKFQTTRTLFGRGSSTSRILGTTPKPSQVRFGTTGASEPPSDAARRGMRDLKNAGNQMKEQAACHADNMANQTKDAAGRVAGTAENIAEKAKQTAQDAWEAAKGTAQKVKDTVAGKTEETADMVKENANAAKRSMNTKEY